MREKRGDGALYTDGLLRLNVGKGSAAADAACRQVLQWQLALINVRPDI